MKHWLSAAILAVVLSFGGVGTFAQTKSQFPELRKYSLVNVEFSICENTIVSITGYGEDDDVRFYVYEVGDIVFAVVEFKPKSNAADAIYILRPDKTVLKFEPYEFGKLESPCKTVEILGLKTERNKF